MLKNYGLYLYHITNKINEFFERQKAYIFCKEGCSKCCEEGEYPWSNIEYQYLMEGFNKLPNETKKIIIAETRKLKEEKKKFIGERFMHKCPFLINKVCSVYEHRGIICRSFGLLTKNAKNGHVKVPFCYGMGLNYSNVYDEKQNILSNEKYKELGIDTPPNCYNVDYAFLTDDVFARGYGFEFGEKKPLLDFLEF